MYVFSFYYPSRRMQYTMLTLYTNRFTWRPYACLSPRRW